MATLITTTPVAATYQSYQLQAYGDMANALNYINQHGGYYGSINLGPTGTWELIIQSSQQNTSQTAQIGDYLVVKNNTTVTVVPQAQYASLYSP